MSKLTTTSAGELMHCEELLFWIDCPNCPAGSCFGARCLECSFFIPYDCQNKSVAASKDSALTKLVLVIDNETLAAVQEFLEMRGGVAGFRDAVEFAGCANCLLEDCAGDC